MWTSSQSRYLHLGQAETYHPVIIATEGANLPSPDTLTQGVYGKTGDIRSLVQGV